MYCMESYYEGTNVINAKEINEDEMLLALCNEGENKLVILNLDTREEKVVIKPDECVFILDMIKIPSNPNFFALHTGKGITLINVVKCKTYELAFNTQSNFNVCHSLAITPIDNDDIQKGFWLAQIDSGAR